MTRDLIDKIIRAASTLEEQMMGKGPELVEKYHLLRKEGVVSRNLSPEVENIGDVPTLDQLIDCNIKRFVGFVIDGVYPFSLFLQAGFIGSQVPSDDCKLEGSSGLQYKESNQRHVVCDKALKTLVESRIEEITGVPVEELS